MPSAFTDRFLQSTHSACIEQFPRACTGCNATYASFAQFVSKARKIGQPKLDAYDDDNDVIGMLCFANCSCDGTMAVRYEDVGVHRAFNAALRHEARSSGRSELDVMVELVREVDARALIEGHPTVERTAAQNRDAAQLEVGAAMVAIVARNKMIIPPIPAVAFKVEQLARNANTSAAAITDVLSGDAALAAAVMQVANTTHYARGQVVTALPVAVGRIGMREVGRIALAAGVGAAASSHGPLAALRQQLWNRSLLMAHVARALAVKRGFDADEGFLCGLLHPMGSIVGTLSVDVYLDAHPSFAAKPLNWWLRVLEMFRVELGALTAARWKLPPLLTDAISGGSRRGDASLPSMIAVVQAAGEVVDVVEWTSAITPETFTLCSSLSVDECEVVANALPNVLDFVAAFEAGLQRPPSSSLVSPTTPTVAACTSDIYVVSKTSRARYRVTAFAENAIVLEGPAPLAENLVAHLDVVDVDPPLSFWATARSGVAIDGGWRVTLSPFAVGKDVYERWKRLLAHQG